MVDVGKLEKLAKLVRFWILEMTTRAGSGHPTSALSAADLMVALFFSKLRFDAGDPENLAGDRVIFSKGHASPLLYALWLAAGVISEKELSGYRTIKSNLEGHPTPRFPLVSAATGSLGQGLSIGLGMALALRARLVAGPVALFPRPTSSLADHDANHRPVAHAAGARRGSPSRVTRPNLPKIYVLMGDSEMAEGSVWEAIELASYYKVGNLVGIIDVNRLGQANETMLGWDVERYCKRLESFGWKVMIIDGHQMAEVVAAFENLPDEADQPSAILAKTVKGKGISFLENKEGWHGKVLDKKQLDAALEELGDVDKGLRGEIRKPDIEIKNQISKIKNANQKLKMQNVSYRLGEMVATRKAYGEALVSLGELDNRVVALDGEVKNSTFAQLFSEKFPERFFEMFIAEQNMVGVAVGMSKRGLVPFVSTFAAFFTRAFDQMRMAAYSGANITFVGSHSGVAIGEDGPSQMGLEDLALFQVILGSVVLVPADAVSCGKLVMEAYKHQGICYLRTGRNPTRVIYKSSEEFKIGGSKVLASSAADQITIIGCGVTVHLALAACQELKKEGIYVRLIDAYSIKPLDEETILKAVEVTGGRVISVEDHYPEGGLGDAVLGTICGYEGKLNYGQLAVDKMPRSGKPEELFEYVGISKEAIIKKVKELLS